MSNSWGNGSSKEGGCLAFVWAGPAIIIVIVVNEFFGVRYWIAALISVPIGIIASFILVQMAESLNKARGYSKESSFYGKDMQQFGCVLILLFLLLYPLFMAVAMRVAWNREYAAAKTPQEKAALKRELENIGVR